jgi:Domain of unknown function (DUF5916)/Carbohydrate family 9 binding domain-like
MISVTKLILVFVTICALRDSTLAQTVERPSQTTPEVQIAQAVRVEEPPKLDGTLDDPIWQQAVPIKDFRQKEPYEGQPATESTEVRILYTHKEIYFGIACHDSAPHVIVATQLRRDVTQELDDYFEIVIDSRHDRRNAYVFQINPLGTQRDALITDEQVGETPQDGDPGWDGVWTSEARIATGGWTATVEIPFSTLNFMRSTDVTWGINFKRFIRRKNEEDLWSGWRRTFGATKVSQAGELHGITDIGSGRLFIIKPYALGGFNHLPTNATASGLTAGTSALSTGGVDIKVGIRSNLVANLTGNTDFADSDVDVQQFNLTPYKLFYPEKRQFFSGQNPYANFAVARVKRSLGRSGSYIGAMGIDKRFGNPAGSFNETGGVDGRAVLFKNLILSGFAAETRTPGLSGGQTNLGAGLIFRSNWLDFEADHRKIGSNFNPAVGFLERADCVCDFADANFKIRPEFAGVRELNFESFIFHAQDTHGSVQTQEWQATFRANFHNGAYTDDDIVDVFAQRLTTPFNIYKSVFIPVGVYNWTRHQLTYGSAQDRRWTVNFFERFGGYYDGTLNEARIRSTYRANERLAFSFSEQWNRFRLPLTNGNFSVVFGALETDCAFSRFLSLSTVLQMDTSNDQGQRQHPPALELPPR